MTCVAQTKLESNEIETIFDFLSRYCFDWSDNGAQRNFVCLIYSNSVLYPNCLWWGGERFRCIGLVKVRGTFIMGLLNLWKID